MTKPITLTNSDIARFWSYVDKSGTHGSWNGTPCWVWTGKKKDNGYGLFGHRVTAHRVSYEMHYGPIPKGFHVLHRCDNRVCVNPHHLFFGTNLDNIQDRVSKHRSACGERHGSHKLTEGQVRQIRHFYRQFNWTQKQIGKIFGVGQDQINRIVNRVLWKHVV